MVDEDRARPADTSFALARFLGMTIEQPEHGRAIAVMHPTGDHVNPHGVVHGAVLFALADTAMGAATYGCLEPGQSCASIEVQLRFLKPVLPAGTLRADIHVVQAGRRIVHLQGEVTHDGRVVASCHGSFAVLAGDPVAPPDAER